MIAKNFPSTTSNNLSTKDFIISILSEEWPLSAREVHSRVQRNGAAISYQAVHKLLSQFCNERVLEKFGAKYQLSRAWIENSKRFISSLDSRYNSKSVFLEKLAKFEGSFDFVFTDVTDFSLSMASFLSSKRCFDSKGSHRIGVMRHGWWPLTFNFDQFLLLKKVGKLNHNPYAIIRKKLPFSIWLNDQYNSVGYRSKVIEGLEEYNDDILVRGSLILQVNYSKETKKAIDDLYTRVSGLGGLFKEYMVSKFPKKSIEIKTRISENPELASTLGKHYMDIWNSN